MTDIRETVARTYADALARSRGGGGGCCGGPAKDTEVSTAGLAGYGTERESYADAAQSSFGCGNPLAFAGVTEGQTVLDLGSGAGLDLLIAAEKVGPGGRVIGVDMTPEMIAAARENARKAGHENVEVREGFIEALPVDDGSVDWVVSNCVINLSPDKEKVFAEIARVLRPGGRFSISDIVAEDLPDWIRQESVAYTACVGGAVSEAEYLAGLEAAGLTDIEVVERRVYDAVELGGLIGEIGVPADVPVVKKALETVAGRVASIKVSGRKA